MISPRDLTQLEQAARLIVEVIERHHVHDEDAEERRAQFRIVQDDPKEEKEENRHSRPLKFTKKEIETMPIIYRNLFFTENTVAHVRRRKDDLIEIRCQVDGKRITATSKKLETAKKKFIGKLHEHILTKEEAKPPTILQDYAELWLETVKRPSIKDTTYKDYLSLLDIHIYPKFGARPLATIKRQELQDFFNNLTSVGKNRAAQKIRQLLTSLFEYAVEDDLIEKSPMARVKLPIYESTNGTALTMEEELAFVKQCRVSGTRSGKAFIFILYCGLRRSELASAQIEGEWVYIVSAKQRKGKQERTRRIPISPRLRKLLPNLETDLEEFKDLYLNRLGRQFKEWLPNHHLHELRHTFITRCQECGIPREVVSLWAGHKADNTMTTNVYTHFSEEFQLREIQKFDY